MTSQPARPHRVVFVLGIIVLCVFVWALYHERSTIVQMTRLSKVTLVWMSLTVWLNVVLTGLTTRIYLRILGVQFGRKQAFWLSSVNFLCGYLPLQLNHVVRGKYLKQLHALDYGSYMAMVIANLLVMLCSMGLYGIGALALIAKTHDRVSLPLAVLFGLCAMLPPLIGALHAHWNDRQVTGRFRRINEAFSTLVRAWRELLLAVLLTVVSLSVLSWRFYLASAAANVDARLELAVLLAPAATLTMYLAITPSALGVRELASSGLSQLLGMDYATGLGVSTIERGVAASWYALLGLLGMFVLGRQATSRDTIVAGSAER